MEKQIFREYDIRGKVGTELKIEQVYDFGRALAAYYLHRQPNMKNVGIGMDNRIHSPAIARELRKALIDSGLNVTTIGICPTPALYFALHTLPIDAGIMVTASHNGPEYNGIKMCIGKEPVWGKDIQEIRRNFISKKRTYTGRHSEHHTQTIIKSYVNWLAEHFAHLKNMPLKILIDCGNGTAGTVLPLLIKKMGWQEKVKLLYEQFDVEIPRHDANPVELKNMLDLQSQILKEKYDFGIGFDGDCDRMAPLTQQGELIAGDQLLALYSKKILAENQAATIIYDIKCSSFVKTLIHKWGGNAHMVPSGHSIIKAELQKTHAAFAGELSCHFFFNDRYFGYDDGIYAALRLFELIIESKSTLTELINELPKTCTSPEFRLTCAESDKQSFITQAHQYFTRVPNAQINTIDGVHATMPYGWGLLRASNTQSAICLRFESDTIAGLKQIKTDFYTALSPVCNTPELKEILL